MQCARLLGVLLAWAACAAPSEEPPTRATSAGRPRARELGIAIGALPTGRFNAITDVAGVGVGHATLVQGADVRTGVTVIVPRLGANAWEQKLPAAVYTGNGYGKAAGFTQVEELGELEAPIALTNTLSVGDVLAAMVRRALAEPGCENVRSINVVVGETNDGRLNDIRGQHVRYEHVAGAWDCATGGPVAEGCVGAGTGTVCCGYKGGIGTSSRVVLGWTVGVLVQTNFGGELRVDGRRFVGRSERAANGDGSCMIVVATDAPLDARNLRRLAKRALFGMARTGAAMSNGSGDYAIAFSTHPECTIPAAGRAPRATLVLPNDAMSPLFAAVMDATEEAILNSLCAAETTTGRGLTVEAIDVEALRLRPPLAGQ
jgi:D-aminopeptidase